MMIEDEISFLRRRARREGELARLTTVPEAATAHRKLAAAYLVRLAQAEAEADGRTS